MNNKRTRPGSRKPGQAAHGSAPVQAGDVARESGELGQQPDLIPHDATASRLFVELDSADLGSELEVQARAPVHRQRPAEDADELIRLAAAPLPPAAPFPATGPLGSRLRAAREARGLSTADVAQRLRIPPAKVVEMEAEGFGQQEVSVFMRGYLKSYARLLELPPVIVASALAQFDAAMPALVATQTVSRSHYLASRYGNSLVYIVLTAVVVVPLLWMARQGSLSSYGIPRMESLDTSASMVSAPVTRGFADVDGAAPAASGSVELPASSSAAANAVAPAPEPVVESPPQPVRAAMTPMPGLAPVEGQRVVLTLTQPSWVEINGADGARIEYALLPEGTRREYQVAGNATLRIGNTRGASLEIDGTSVPLAPHTVANVALVKLGDAERH